MGQMSPVFPVHSVYNVPVPAGQPWGLPCSVTPFCSSSVDLPDTSVPAVHLVSLLHVPPFQVELFGYPDHAATAYILSHLGWISNWLRGLVVSF